MLNSSPRPPIAPIADQQGIISPVWLNWCNGIFRLLGFAPTIYTGIIAPNFTPYKIGDDYINTATGKCYKSVGVTSSADWKILN